MVACDSGTGLESRAGVAVSFATHSATTSPSATAPRAASNDTITLGQNTLIITKAEIVLREIEFDRAGTDACASGADGCEEVEIGPVLVDLPLTPGVKKAFQADIPAGTYDEVEFEIHKVSGDDPADATFRQQHPDFVEISIRVQGTYNGTAFVFTTDLNVDQEHTLNPPLVIDATTQSTNVTILVELSRWFIVDNVLVNPTEGNKGGRYESEIKSNIVQSIEAFEDRDSDGGKN